MPKKCALDSSHLPTLQISDQTWRQLVPAGVTEDVQSEHTTYKYTTTLAFGCAAARADNARRALPIVLVGVNEHYEHVAYRKSERTQGTQFKQSLCVSTNAGASWVKEPLHVSDEPMQCNVVVSVNGDWACIALFNPRISVTLRCALSARGKTVEQLSSTVSPQPPITMVAVRNDGSGLMASEKELFGFEALGSTTSLCYTGDSSFVAVATNECKDIVLCDLEHVHVYQNTAWTVSSSAKYVTHVVMNEHWCLVTNMEAACSMNTQPGDFSAFAPVESEGMPSRAGAAAITECNNHWLVAYNTGELWYGSPVDGGTSPPSVWMPVSNPGFTWSAAAMCNPIFLSVPVVYVLADGIVYSNMSTFSITTYVLNQPYRIIVSPQ